MDNEQQRIGPSFTVTEIKAYQLHRVRVTFLYVLGGVGLALVVIAVITASILFIAGREDRVLPYLQAIGPYVLPILGGLTVFAFGRTNSDLL